MMLVVLIFAGPAFAVCSTDPCNPTLMETIIVEPGKSKIGYGFSYKDPDGNVPPFGPYAIDINILSKPSWITVGPLIINDPNVIISTGEISPCDGSSVLANQTVKAARWITIVPPINAVGTFPVVVMVSDDWNARRYGSVNIKVNRPPFLGLVAKE